MEYTLRGQGVGFAHRQDGSHMYGGVFTGQIVHLETSPGFATEKGFTVDTYLKVDSY